MTRGFASLAAEGAGIDIPLDNTVAIETPEHIRFRHYAAGPTRRCLAYLIDWLVRLVAVGVIAGIIMSASGGSESLEGIGSGMVLVIVFGIEWAYHVLFESLANGRTPGKRLLHLRVVKNRGEPITFIDSLLRNLLRAADFLPAAYVLGAVAMVADRRFRRLGDLVAGTMVVIEHSTPVVAPPALQPPPALDELAALPTRLPLTTEELVALDMFVRRGALSEPRRVELAETVAPLWASRMGLQVGDPVRFLALMHLRAWGHKAAQSQQRARER